jgi:putative oxidoreductase
MANGTESGGGVVLAGRILMGVIFLVSGFFKVAGYSQMVGFAASKGLPMAGVAIGVAAAIELLGGLAIVTGFQARIVAWVLFVYLIPVTLTLHNFWAAQGMEQQNQMVHFLKNLAIMGGLLLLASYGPGRMAIGARKEA